MAFSTATLVKYLRDSVLVQDPSMEDDPVWLNMSDDDLALVLEVSMHRDFPNQVLSSLANGVVYPLMLVAKKELYYRLAVKSAPKYDLKGDNAGELHRSQRFKHFYALIQQIDEELENYMENGYFSEDGIGDLDDNGTTSRNKVYVREALVTSRYYSRRNYGLYEAPAVSVFVDSLDSSRVQLHWKATGTRVFVDYKVYISTSEIYDEYKHQIDPNATLIFSTSDQRKTACEYVGLNPSTRYHILVAVKEANGIYGYGGVVFDTPTPVVETPITEGE